MTAVKLALSLGAKLTLKKQSLALAESCTGGRIASAMTAKSGASKYFFGGVVCYANESKHDLLGVKNSTLKAKGAVSKETVLEMARGAKKAFQSDWALAVSGIAGPTGGSRAKPVGLVFFAVVGPKVEVVEKKNFRGNRKRIQESAAQRGMALILENLV